MATAQQAELPPGASQRASGSNGRVSDDLRHRPGSVSPSGPTAIMTPSQPSAFDFELPAGLTRRDLTSEPLLRATRRVDVASQPCPALGGIPLLRRIGQGAMGTVYLGYHPRLRKEVAVKVLDCGPRAEDAIIQRFLREAQLAAQVQSPHLVSVLDVNEENGLFFIVMEFVLGKSAQDYLREITAGDAIGLDESVALEICAAACEGLAAAHIAGIVHRDIKPDNILLPQARDREGLDFGAAKLADLGLARSEQRGTVVTLGQFGMGTPGYVAPEQAVNASKAGKPSDVYALASTLYALLAGRAPFAGDEPMALVVAVIQDDPPPIEQFRQDLSARTRDLIARCLKRDPQQRCADGVAMLVALKDCRAAAAGLAPPSMKSTRKVQKKPQTIAAPDESPPQRAKAPPSAVPVAVSSPGLAGSSTAATESRHSRGVFGAIGASVVWGYKSLKYARALSRGRGALEQQRWGEAMAAFSEAAQLRQGSMSPDPAAADGLAAAKFGKLIAEGNAATEAKNWDAAVLAFHRALEVRPGDAAAQTLFHAAYARQVDALYNSAMDEARKELGGERIEPRTQCYALDPVRHVRVTSALERALSHKKDDAEAAKLKSQVGEPRDLALDLGAGVTLDVVRVLPGEGDMGAGDGPPCERPVHRVTLSRLYFIGRHPVTVAQFRRFVDATGHVTDAERRGCGISLCGKLWGMALGVHWRQPGFIQSDNHPVVLVSWNDALAFAAWATKNAAIAHPQRAKGFTVVLPSEAQWEYAARGAAGLRYPWGNSWDASRANHADASLRATGWSDMTSMDNDGSAYTSACGQYPNASWCGAADMIGNVWEWCHDWFADTYYHSCERTDPMGPPQGDQRTQRGGSWADMSLKCRAHSRRNVSPGEAAANAGFRIALIWPS